MKLYYSPGTSSLSAHIALREAGLPFTPVLASTGTHRLADGTDYRTINPRGYVPLLELDDGERLAEGPVIVQYVADQVPARKLAPPPGTLARYRLGEWLNFITSELYRNYTPLFDAAMPEAAKTIHRRTLGARYTWVESQLVGKDYLMGSDFTVADASLFVVTGWAGFVDVDLGAYDNVRAFMARVAARPAVQEALKAEGLLQ
jgi:glutathione S-transferase